jgi:hypothetical protein
MLTNIENRLEELFEQIEMLPPDKVEAAEKVVYDYAFNDFCFTCQIIVMSQSLRTVYSLVERLNGQAPMRRSLNSSDLQICSVILL